jgi:FlaA1/EpsC-like NDP-sugar epimerase
VIQIGRRKGQDAIFGNFETIQQAMVRKGINKMKILIAGARGMIGSTVTPYLASQGHEVVRLV